MKNLLCASALLVAGVVRAEAAAPTATITQVGRLLDASDAPVNGAVPMTFSFYATYDATGDTTPLWSETYTVNVTGGVYAIVLGDQLGANNGKKALPASLFDVPDRYLALKVGADASEMSPRLRVNPAPYAVRAQTAASADTVPDGTLTVAKLKLVNNQLPGLDAATLNGLDSSAFAPSAIQGDITAIKTSVGATVGADASAIKASVGASVGADASAIKASVGGSVGADVTALKAAVGATEGSDVGAIKASVGSSVGADVAALKAAVGATEGSDVSAIKASVGGSVGADVTALKSAVAANAATLSTLTKLAGRSYYKQLFTSNGTWNSPSAPTVVVATVVGGGGGASQYLESPGTWYSTGATGGTSSFGSFLSAAGGAGGNGGGGGAGTQQGGNGEWIVCCGVGYKGSQALGGAGVMGFGAGGATSFGAGGGSGYVSVGTLTVQASSAVTITVGVGGSGASGHAQPGGNGAVLLEWWQ